MYEGEELINRKRIFAAALLRTPLDPMTAALATDPRRHYATVICNTWQYDADVQEHMREIEATAGAAARIPTRDDVASRLYTEATSIRDKDTALKYYELLAKIMGYIEKPATQNVNVNNIMDNRKVVMLPATTSLDDWEAAAIQQQREITGVAS